jgi:two-component system sensor histidine kinase TctE
MLGLSLGLLTAGIAFFLLIRTYADRAAERAFDRLLAASALSIAGGVQIENGRLTADLPFASHSILNINPMSRVFYRISAPDGTFITGYPGLGAGMRPVHSADPVFADGRFLDTEVRIVTLGRFAADPAAGGWVSILVAESTEDRRAFAAGIVEAALVPMLAIVLLAAVFGWIVIQQALRPLAALEKAISAREPADLAPVNASVPREVEALVNALNTLMQRLAGVFARMQGFLGEAAHQIRTPLAALRAQIEVALDEKDMASIEPRLHRAHRNAVAITRLTSQLLADTMVAHRSEAKPLMPLDAVALAERTVAGTGAAGEDRACIFSPPADGAALLISGDDVMLAEALKNLIDNALKYAGAPVTVTVAGGDTVRIAVTDSGPGIALEDRARLCERFARGAGTEGTIGSGLGLAIAARVAAHHGGTLEFSGGAGAFTVTMTFRRFSEGAA